MLTHQTRSTKSTRRLDTLTSHQSRELLLARIANHIIVKCKECSLPVSRSNCDRISRINAKIRGALRAVTGRPSVAVRMMARRPCVSGARRARHKQAPRPHTGRYVSPKTSNTLQNTYRIIRLPR